MAEGKLVSTFERQNVIIFLALAVLAFGTRSVGLAEWHLLADEYFTFFNAQDRFRSLVNPGYYAATVLSFEIFGKSEWAARLPAFIFGFLSVPLLFLCWRRVVGSYAAGIGAVLLLMSSWHLWWSQQARFYSAVVLLSLLAYYWLYRSIREDRLSYLFLGLAASCLAALFHLTAVMIPAAFVVFSMLVSSFHQQFQDYSKRIAVTALAIGALVGIIAIPLLWNTLERWSAMEQTWGYGPVGLLLQTIKYVQLPYVAAGGFGLIAIAYRNFPLAMFFTVAISVPAFLLIGLSSMVSVRPDYLIYILPLVTVLAGSFCATVRDHLVGKQFLEHSVAVIIVMMALPEFVSHYSDRMSLDIREAYSYVEEHFEEDDRVMSFEMGFNRYTEKEYELEDIPGNLYANSIDWQEDLKRLKQPGTRAWVVVPIGRRLRAKELDEWLSMHARLQWRDVARRFDYTHRGYEVYLVGSSEERN